MTDDELRTVAEVAARAAVAALEELERERVYGIKVIAAECGVTEVTLRSWVAKRGFPLDKDPAGFSVLRADMRRWLAARRKAVAGFRGY